MFGCEMFPQKARVLKTRAQCSSGQRWGLGKCLELEPERTIEGVGTVKVGPSWGSGSLGVCPEKIVLSPASF
jgi:hypothetical protein